MSAGDKQAEVEKSAAVSKDRSTSTVPERRVPWGHRRRTNSNHRRATVRLPDPATVAVVGGGPAGSFFAIRLLRKSRERGISVDVVILEKKTEICFYRPVEFRAWEGCNYCAGGISPRLADILKENHISLPEAVIESRAVEVTVHGDWKSIQLPVPPDREMMSVFRGSRPLQRAERYSNFDTFLLQTAVDEGARVITAEAKNIRYSSEGRPVIACRTAVVANDTLSDETIEADFVVFAAGVNRAPGMNLESDPLLRSLEQMIPHLRPPRVRKAVIAELQADEDVLEPLEGEVHFAQYGSKEIDIEMSSLIPKGRWMTVALLGRTIDRASPSQYLQIVQQFVDLPHIRLLLPARAKLRAGCCCHPNMTVGAARNPFGERVALAGDMAVSRLYKDGLYSAYVTASALADCILDEGIDRASLARCYRPIIQEFRADNRYGRVIFLLSRWVFRNPALSRVLYQAVITERKTTPHHRRRLAEVLWSIASGDDSYRHIALAAAHPATAWLILTGGLLVTIRNRITELLFGLDWSGIERYSTGVPLEEVPKKRLELFSVLGAETPTRAPQLERMYSIRVRADREAIFRQLYAFGDPQRQYFKPRFIHIRRLAGMPSQAGAITRYQMTPSWMSFDLGPQKVVEERYLFSRILDGFGQGGIFSFDVKQLKPGVNLLTIYVGFDFPKGKGLWRRLFWMFFSRIFPQYAHDVLWNHALCKIKYLAEQERDQADPGDDAG